MPPIQDDQGLSTRGQQQAQELALRMTSQWTTGVRLLSSPKRRCVETAEHLSRALNVKVEILPELDECLSSESSQLLEQRVENFLEAAKHAAWGDTVIVVSHSDWLERAANVLFGFKLELQWGYATCHVVELNLQRATFLKTV